MDKVCDTLFLPLEHGAIPVPAHAAFINAAVCPALEVLRQRPLFLQQYSRPRARALQDAGLAVLSDFPAAQPPVSAVFIRIPKDIDEARYLLARGLDILEPGGFLVAAAGNKEGGARLKKMFGAFGLTGVGEESKHKARVVWARKSNIDQIAVDVARAGGGLQKAPHGLFSMPGIFGWDKIDKGSQMLAQHLPGDLGGAGADFGCGYGFLSLQILRRCPGVSSLSCIDADYRAVTACRENLKSAEGKKVQFSWDDVLAPKTVLRDLDFVVMNPPFHDGRQEDIATGRGFIAAAASSLRPGGCLWMVANAHLPYEDFLRGLFASVQNLHEAQGFKIICAHR